MQWHAQDKQMLQTCALIFGRQKILRGCKICFVNETVHGGFAKKIFFKDFDQKSNQISLEFCKDLKNAVKNSCLYG